MKTKNPKVAKILAYVAIVCGLGDLVINYLPMRNEALAEIKFSDLYSFITSIFLLAFGVYLLKKIQSKK